MLKTTLLIAALVFNGQVFAAKKKANKLRFSQSELITDFKITHKVKTANMLGEETEQLVVIGENKSRQAILVIYRLNSENQQYREYSRIDIPSNFLAYDLLESNNRHKLIFQTNQQLIEYLPSTNSFSNFAKTQSIYQQPKAQFLASKDFIRDVNGDGLDDITIADFGSIHLMLQNNEGGFIKQTIPIKPKVQVNSNSATFTETPLFFADLNQDDKQDLITVEDSSLTVYHQNGHGSFKQQVHNLQLPIDVKALNWWEVRESDGETVDQNELSHRSMFRIEDVNNDQIADLMVRFSQSEGVLDRQNNYELYLGKVESGKLTYAKKPDSVISSDGTIAGVRIVDINGDNKSEIIVSSLDIGVSQIIGALLSGSIDQDIYVFKMDEEDNFSKDPNVDKEVELNFSLSSGKSGEPVVKLADFDGDGLKDLMFSNGEKSLKVYQGTKKKRLFTKRSTKHKVLLPKDGDFLDTADLNNDGKQDVIIRYGRQDDIELNNRLIFLFAQ